MCFIVSAVFASIAIGILTLLIAVLHLRDFPRASWGSISQALIFHQVRKYLLLLDPRKEHVKFWRPQMLLLVSNPRSAINLIDFVNDMKKGGLFILGHVKINSTNEDSNDICSQESPYWISLIDQMKIKAFVDMTSAPTIRDGVVQLIRLAGLGGLRPNTIILGFYDHSIPEDKLSTHSFYKRRWLKSGLRPDASTITLDSFNGSTYTNVNDIDSILHFPSRTISYFIVRTLFV
jgi:potassium/chloride transporter 9